MENDKQGPGHSQTSRPPELVALVCALERIAAAVEHIEKLLGRRPPPSRRQSALAELLGEASRVVVPPPSAPHAAPHAEPQPTHPGAQTGARDHADHGGR